VVPVFDALVRMEYPHPSARNFSQETREFMLSYGKNPESLSHLGLNRYQSWQMDGRTYRRTDRIMIASARLALRAVACTNADEHRCRN